MNWLRSLAALAAAVLLAAPALAQAPRAPSGYAEEVAGLLQSDVETAAQCPVVFVGSSSIRVWRSLKQDMAPAAVLNRGFGGSTVEDVNQFFEPLLARVRPSAIFFYAGDNDIHAGAPPAKVEADFAAFLEVKTAALGATPVYFLAIKPSPSRLRELPRQRAANAAIERMAGERADLYFVDVASPMLAQGRPRAELFVEDELHMNAEGYAIWTGLIRPLVLQEAARRAQPCPS